MKKTRTLDFCYVAIFVAIITVFSWLCFPLGEIKYTFQLLGIILCGGLLGVKRGVLAVSAYLLLGALGVPVFSNFTAGLFSSPTNGYAVGFLATVILVGVGFHIATKNQNLHILTATLFTLLGVFVCYVSGTVWFMFFYAGTKEISFLYAVSVCVLPYVWFDTIKIAVGIVIVEKLKKFIK